MENGEFFNNDGNHAFGRLYFERGESIQGASATPGSIRRFASRKTAADSGAVGQSARRRVLIAREDKTPDRSLALN